MIFSSEDLPVPFGPTTPIFAPCRNDSVTRCRDDLVAMGLAHVAQGETHTRHGRQPWLPHPDETSSGRTRPTGEGSPPGARRDGRQPPGAAERGPLRSEVHAAGARSVPAVTGSCRGDRVNWLVPRARS